MGAMTQFVPVWSGTSLHSRKLARVQLWLVSIGVTGFGATLLVESRPLIHIFGGLILIGFWVFIYNISRSFPPVSKLDVTERHFAFALFFFFVLTILGYLLAVSFFYPVFSLLPLSRSNTLKSHATLAVFGAVLTTILGALYQLATMFTQTELHGIDIYLQKIEEVGYPVGVLLLAIARMFSLTWLGKAGGLLLLTCLVCFSFILARRLFETNLEWTPMLRRYGVVAISIPIWVVYAFLAWSESPLEYSNLFGMNGITHILFIGVIGFTVLGTLYHIVPFIIWVHRYSDQLGLEPVPMVDDLYDNTLAKLDFLLILIGGIVILIPGRLFEQDQILLVSVLTLSLGIGIFIFNMFKTIQNHSEYDIYELLTLVI